MVRYSKLFVHSALLFTIPSVALYPQDELSQGIYSRERGSYEQLQEEGDRALSYDRILELLEEIESGELEEKCTPQELERINQFIALLAKEGALPDAEENSLLAADIEELLHGEENPYAYAFHLGDSSQYEIVPAVFNGYAEAVLCKSWLKKQWKQTKKFVKKHKREIIIGAVVVVAVVAVAVVVVSATAGVAVAGAAAAVGAAGAADSAPAGVQGQKGEVNSLSSVSENISSAMEATYGVSNLKEAMNEQVFAFKETIVKEQFFQSNGEGLSLEENGRALGSLFAHESLKNIGAQISQQPNLFQEIQGIGSQFSFPVLQSPFRVAFDGHQEIDQKFSTEYASLYGSSGSDADFNTRAYQVRGEKALECGYYEQAVHDLGKAIELNPANPLSYLERGVAHFGLGDYDRSIEDYHQFASQMPTTYSLSLSEFTVGFARGLPRGAYESGEGMILFLTDFVKHPIHTSGQVVDSITTLVNLVRNDEWGVVCEALAPEIHELVTQWETLPSNKRGELVGYAVGKYGADILVPGGLAKIATKSVKGAREVAAVCKNLHRAQETLLLETTAEIGNIAKVAEVVEVGQKTARLADELGFTAREMGALKQAGQLDVTIQNTVEHLHLPMQESIKLFTEAERKLKPYQGIYMPEFELRELVHAAGIPTFPRPKGIPENYRVKLSDKSGGIKYVHPTDEGTYIRIMPGKAHSKNPCQQKPYVNQRIHGESLDKHGNLVSNKAEEAHIPFEEFVYSDLVKN